ncbi:unnamed protein product [Soboliphyme baturini]|uniref:DUF1330 domain-containing protein n=1 Tax=Soboliphyme baturini TaxID=241478 RepID=A0A183J2S4_9BILA|nr:unnamed protein product [Soboliphyme baturini]
MEAYREKSHGMVEHRYRDQAVMIFVNYKGPVNCC